VAKLADAQPSEGCDRKVMEVQFLSSAPIDGCDMMKRVILFGLIGVALAASARAQLIKPIDYRKEADIDTKSANLPALNLHTQTEPSRTLSVLPFSNKQPELKQLQQNQLDLNGVDFSFINACVLPQQNFTAKRAVISDQLLDQPFITIPRAPITSRQIKAYTPQGTEELKKQLSTIPK
jgi:hypothetical protein